MVSTGERGRDGVRERRREDGKEGERKGGGCEAMRGARVREGLITHERC